jgi:non-specific serine/threonine protein kinase
MKTDRRIISDLPDKIEVKALCPLTRKQATIYTRLVEELKRGLADPKLQPFERSGLVLGFLLKFKQICNHPSHWSGDGQYKPEDSGKFMRLAEIADELAQRQERAIVFTQFAEMCDPLSHHLATVFGRSGLVLHGGTPVAQRSRLVEQFQAPDGPPFFVISVKAGGTGLTLTRASHVIHFDRWWNPAIENQATDRAFRIGQKKNVLVHKFVVPGTIEDRIDRLIEEKKTIATELLGNDTGGEALISRLSSAELLRLVSLDIETIED